MPASPDPLIALEPPAIDACWQRIGVRGDRSCERLLQHVHCHNCERYAEAAALLLDRHELDLETVDEASFAEDRQPDPLADGETLSVLIFRIGQNWLALPSTLLLEVSLPVPVHGLPYPRNRSLRGLCNVRGTLVPCMALDLVLGLTTETTPQDRPHMLILDTPGGPLVTEVQTVEGIYAIPLAKLQKTGHASGLAVSQLASAVMQWRQHSITVLHADRLLQALSRSLR